MNTQNSKLRFVFFGSPDVSHYILDELEKKGLRPLKVVSSSRDPLPLEELQELDADVFIVASFGKILPEELIYMPKYKTLNIHPSLLPRLRGTSPIKSTILLNEKPGVTIMLMDKEMDHGPILAQKELALEGILRHPELEKKLWETGGELLAEILPDWIEGKVSEVPQDESQATYTHKISKEDGLLNLNADAETNLRKVYAYDPWPGTYFFFRTKMGKDIRIVVKNAKIQDGKFIPTRVIPEGKKEMSWDDFLRGHAEL
ncbi:MAG: methionyl-tRNA formyltransferase [Parcubacteria group bacterium]